MTDTMNGSAAELQFGERVKQYRKAKGMTQQELADRLGVSNKSVSRWESGAYPDVPTLGPLARALGVTVDELLGGPRPLRRLERADWQNLLSFGFILGGGVGFFLLDLFAPAPVCYGLYLAAMAYGVYLQQHYTYHSRWFHSANLAMNFFVNWRLVGALGSLAWMNVSLYTLLFGWLQNGTDGAAAANPLFLLYGLWLLAATALTALTGALVRRYVDGRGFEPHSLRLCQAKPDLVSLLPALCPVVLAGFWLYYSGDVPREPTLYKGQAELYRYLLLAAALFTAVVLWFGHRRGKLLPAAAMLLGCALYPKAALWARAYSLGLAGLVPVEELTLRYRYYLFGEFSPALGLLAAGLTVGYLLCCCVRLERGKPGREETAEPAIPD